MVDADGEYRRTLCAVTAAAPLEKLRMKPENPRLVHVVGVYARDSEPGGHCLATTVSSWNTVPAVHNLPTGWKGPI